MIDACTKDYLTNHDEQSAFRTMHAHRLDCVRILQSNSMIRARTSSDDATTLLGAFRALQKLAADMADSGPEELRVLQLIARGTTADIARLEQILTPTRREFEESRQVIIRSCVRLTYNIASMYQNRGFDNDELIDTAFGALGLAIDRFDPTNGSRLTTYASCYIHGLIKREVQTWSKALRVPHHLHDLVLQFRVAYKVLIQASHHRPTTEEIAIACGISIDDAHALTRMVQAPISMDEQDNHDEDGWDSIQSNPDTATEYFQIQLRESLDLSFEILSEECVMIIKMLFGLDTGFESTLEEVALVFNVSRENIRCRKDTILHRLQNNRHLQYDRDI